MGSRTEVEHTRTWPRKRSSRPRRRRSSGPLRSAPSARARPSCRACFYSRSTSEPLVMARRCQRAFRSACAPPASHCSCPVSTALCNTSSIRDGLRNAGTRCVSSAPAAVQPPILPRQLRQAPDMPSPHSHHHQLLHPHNHHHPQKSLQSEPHKQPRRRRPKEPHARDPHLPCHRAHLPLPQQSQASPSLASISWVSAQRELTLVVGWSRRPASAYAAPCL